MCIMRKLRFIVLLALYYASHLIPRNKHIWVFGSLLGYRFSDNPKYLFMHVVRSHPEIRAIWLTHNQEVLKHLIERGYEAYKALSLKGFFYSLRAGCTVFSTGFDDINKYTIGGSKIIQLWHGTPLKKILYDDKVQFLQRPKDTNMMAAIKMGLIERISPLKYANFDVLIATSEESRKNLSSAFASTLERVFITGYPRNDALLDANKDEVGGNAYLDNVKKQVAPTYILTYLPTFRDTHIGDPGLFKSHFDIEATEKLLERLNAVLIIKTHFHDNRFKLPSKENGLKRIFNPLEKELSDIYPLLRETDVLITDYSSVFFDFLLLNRPIIFTPFDLDEYIRKDRELYYNYSEVTPGPKAKTWAEVLSLVEEVLREDTWQKEREEVNNRFNKYKDSNSSERVFKIIQEAIN